MTAWQDFSPADFDARKAPKYVRQNADAGQVPLFATGTPTREIKATAAQVQLPGQADMFSDDTEGT